MVHKCAACGCSCGYNKHDAVKDLTSHLSPSQTHNLCLEGSALLQSSALPLSATFVTSTQRTDAANEVTNELSEAVLTVDFIQGCTLDVIQSRLSIETLPDGFVCNKIFEKLLLYKLDIIRGIILVECGIILTSDFQVTCSSYNEILPVNIYEDLLSKSKQITSIAQLLSLMIRLCSLRQDHSVVKTEADEKYSAVIEAFDIKLEPEELSVSTVSVDFITQSSLSENYLAGGCENESKIKYEDEISTSERSAESNCAKASVKEEDESGSETSDADSSVTQLTDVERTAEQKEKSHKCLECDSCFSRKIYLTTHTKRVHSQVKPYECSFCDKKFSLRRDRHRHCRLVHREKPYHCDQCDYKCSTKCDLTRHQRTVHNLEKRFGCDQCEYKSSTKCNLKKHINTVHQRSRLKSHLCTECSRRFTRNDHLQAHIKAVHRREKLHLCSVCCRSFSRMSDVRRHEATVHDSKT